LPPCCYAEFRASRPPTELIAAEEDPAEGPASRFTVEERFRGFRVGVGYSRHDIDEATVWDIRQEEWENAMIDAQWE